MMVRVAHREWLTSAGGTGVLMHVERMSQG